MTPEFILEATGARLEGAPPPPGTTYPGVFRDTRALEAGGVYLALAGANFDGHAFLAQAHAAGAAAAIVAAGRALPEDTPDGLTRYAVADPLAAYGALARAHRRAFGGSLAVVGVTGSSGKTSTKELLAAYLGRWGAVSKTFANYNNDVGVPLTLLGVPAGARFAVVEMGMRGPGEIARLAAVAEPDVAVVTNAGTAHLERLGTREAIADAKAELFWGLRPGGTAVVNADDPRLVARAEAWGGRRISFSLTPDAGADVFAQGPATPAEDGGQQAEVSVGGARVSLYLPLWGSHHLANALAALATGLALGYRPPAALSLRPEALAGRGSARVVGGVTLVDEAYNANPESMRASLGAFAGAPASGPGRRFVVLGDMGELGSAREAGHRETAAFASSLGLAGVFAVGENAGLYREGAASVVALGREAAPAALARVLAPGDTVLFKGSRSARLETLIDALASHLEGSA